MTESGATCADCGHEHTEHNYSHGVCRICKYAHTEHVYSYERRDEEKAYCTVCNGVHFHKYTDLNDEGAYCAGCDQYHYHDGYNREFVNGRCQYCGYSHAHPACAATCAHDGEHQNLAFLPFGMASANNCNGNYYLSGTHNASLYIPEGSKMTLCLNGYDLSAEKIEIGGELTICDCAEKEKLILPNSNGDFEIFNKDDEDIYYDAENKVIYWMMYDSDNNQDVPDYSNFQPVSLIKGAMINTNHIAISGKLNLYGGNLLPLAQYVVYPDIININSNGEFNMYGGSISHYQLINYGDIDRDVLIRIEDGVFNMYGGTIEKNETDILTAFLITGGIYGDDYTNRTANIYGGSISNNRVEYILSALDNINIYGGSISDNTINTVLSAATINMSGGSISNNKLLSQEGWDLVAVYSTETINISGGSITNNKGIGILSCGTVEISGGVITGNTECGVEVFLAHGSANPPMVVLSGNPQIYGNGTDGKNNVNLGNYTISIAEGGLSEGANIGVSGDIDKVIANANDTDYSRYFFSDAGYDIVYTADKTLQFTAPIVTLLTLDGDNITAKNATETAAVLVVASYDENGDLVDVKLVNAKPQSVVRKTITETGVNTQNAKTVKAFLWDSLTTMKPIVPFEWKTYTN